MATMHISHDAIPVPGNLAAAPCLQAPAGRYTARLANSLAERQAAFRLRFLVFNLELHEGLDSAYRTGYDIDPFDEVCDHLIVEDSQTRQVVGTYRMQTGICAQENRGYYSAGEFDLSPYERIRSRLLELGRACVHRDHRSFEVITLLWKGIAEYALANGCNYLIGCSSLASQNEAMGAALYERLQKHLAPPELRTLPLPTHMLPAGTVPDAAPTPPKLLRTYLALGARICAPPAIDREFKTIDFLTLLDLNTLVPAARQRYLGF